MDSRQMDVSIRKIMQGYTYIHRDQEDRDLLSSERLHCSGLSMWNFEL